MHDLHTLIRPLTSLAGEAYFPSNKCCKALLYVKYAYQSLPTILPKHPNAPGPQALSPSSCQNPSSLQQCLQQARAGNQHACNSQQLTQEAAAELYQQGMQILLELDSRSVQESYFMRQQQTSMEFQQWLSRLPWNRDMYTCISEDVAFFCTTSYLQQHTGTATPIGMICAPSSLDTMLSCLSSSFDKIGRTAAWGSKALQGNPIKSDVIADMKRGYHNWSFEAGYSRKPATPIPFTELQQLLAHLHQQITSSSTSPAEKALLARDGSLFSMMWHTSMRGGDVSRLQLADIVHATDNTPVLSWIAQPGINPDGHFFSVHPYGTKTQHSAHAGSAILQYTLADSTCPIQWLSMHMQQAINLHQPITSWLYRTLDSHSKHFTQAPLSSSALNNRLSTHLKAANMYQGQTPHGMRRGQHLHHQQYMSLAAASSNAGIKTLSVAAMYADSHSHMHQGRLR